MPSLSLYHSLFFPLGPFFFFLSQLAVWLQYLALAPVVCVGLP